MDRAREAGLEREDVTALVTSVLEERYAGTTVAAGKTEASGARSTGE
jgi:GntR family transcriptional regulator